MKRHREARALDAPPEASSEGDNVREVEFEALELECGEETGSEDRSRSDLESLPEVDTGSNSESDPFESEWEEGSLGNDAVDMEEIERMG